MTPKDTSKRTNPMPLQSGHRARHPSLAAFVKRPQFGTNRRCGGEYNEALPNSLPSAPARTMPAFRRLLFKLLLSSCALLAPLALPIAATAQSSETDAALDRIRQQVDAAQQSVKRAAAASSAAGTGDAGDLGLADDELQNLRSNAAAARTKA